MTNTKQTSPAWIVAIALIFWLFFMNGLSTVQRWSASGAPADIARTISRGASRTIATPIPAAPAANPIAAPRASSGAAAAQLPADQAAADAAADAAYQATVQAVNAAQPPAAVAQPAAVAPISSVPTAVVLIPTAVPIAQAVVVPQSMPALAPGSDMRPSPVPTMAYPTPLPAAIANAYTLSPDAKCITVERGGKRYQACQDWPYRDAEARSIADLMRTGVIPGVEVQ